MERWQQSNIKVERGLQNVINQLLEEKRDTWKKLFIRSNVFQQLWTESKERFSGSFASRLPSFFVYENQVREKME